MDDSVFEVHLRGILHGWQPFVDHENGGIFTYPASLKKERHPDDKNPLRQMWQMYNFAVGAERALPGTYAELWKQGGGPE